MSRLDDVIADVAYILDTLMVYRNVAETGNCNTCKNKDCQWRPKLGQLVRYNCPHYKAEEDNDQPPDGNFAGNHSALKALINMQQTFEPSTNCSEIPNSSDSISRQAAIETLDEQIALCDKALKSFEISMKDEYAVKVERASLVAYKEQLEALPSADVAPVIRGKWIHDGHHRRCDRCGTYFCNTDREGDTIPDNFCPHCGAKMDGKREE